MTSFEIKRQIEYIIRFQGLYMSEFKIVNCNQIENNQIISNFIKSKQFRFDSLNDYVNSEPIIRFSKKVFDFERIIINDFYKTDKNGVLKYLVDFLNKPDWGSDKIDFFKVLERYFDIHNNLNDGDFYILSKDMFDWDREKLINPFSGYLIYCFFIFSIDSLSSTLTMTEWTYG